MTREQRDLIRRERDRHARSVARIRREIEAYAHSWKIDRRRRMPEWRL